MAIRSLKSGTFSRSGMVGNPVIMPGSYDSLQTVTVGAGGASYIEFTSIPSTYSHLQVRAIMKNTTGGNDSWSASAIMYFNTDTTAGNYARHYVYGYGSGTAAAGSADNIIPVGFVPGNGQSGVFGATVIDIHDYANTNKYKTVKSIAGADSNDVDSEFVGFFSGLWKNTAAVTNIRIYCGANSFAQNSSFALYGVN